MQLQAKVREIFEGLFHRKMREQEMDEEMEFYLDRLTERYLERGLNPEDAQKAARREFGVVEHWKEEVRREKRGFLLADVVRDLRHSIKSLYRAKGFSAVVVMTLALGIGINTAVFCVLKAVYINPLPLPDSDRLIFINEMTAEQSVGPVAFANYLDWRDSNQTCSDMGAYFDSHQNITDGETPVRVRIARMTASLVDVLGVAPMIGRNIQPEDEEENRVVLLGFEIWNSRYAADTEITGTTIDLDSVPHVVIGVLPPEFTLPSTRNLSHDFDLYFPMPASSRFDPRVVHSYQVLARLKDGISVQVAQEDLAVIAGQLATRYPESNEGRGIQVDTVHHALFGESGHQIMLILGAAGLVLLIACANIASLQLARGIRQRKEYAIRATLGANRSRIVRQLISESGLLAAVGGAGAYLMAIWSITVLQRIIPPEIPRGSDVHLDLVVFLFSLVVAIMSALLFSFTPALSASRLDLAEVLKEGHCSSSYSPRRRWHRTALVTGQFALSLVLANISLLMLQSYIALRRTDPGIEHASILTMALSLGGPTYRDSSNRMSFYSELLPALESIPGVSSVGAAGALPLEGEGPLMPIHRVDSGSVDQSGEESLVNLNLVTGDYFQAQGIPIHRGRALTMNDMLRSSPRSVTGVVINQMLAKELWLEEDPIGRHISLRSDGSMPMEVVGVTGNVHQRGLESKPEPELYVPYSMLFLRRMFLTIQTEIPPMQIIPEVRQMIDTIDPTLPVSEIRTLEEIIDTQYARREFYTTIIGIFSGSSLFCMGNRIESILSIM